MANPEKSADTVAVYLADTLVGRLHDTDPLSFEYAETWLAPPNAAPLAAIPLQAGRQDSPAVQAFFENLLPEGDVRQQLSAQHQTSTPFALLRAVAGDTAGGCVIVPMGQAPSPSAYQATTWEAIAKALGKASTAAVALRGQDARISLAGAQDKAGLAIFADGIPRLPLGNSPSTHILKPNIRQLAKVWHSAANEAIVMRAASLCGLPTAEVFYEPLSQSCIIKRFDRVPQPDGSLGRLMQYDLCQLAGIVSGKKYEIEGGPGLVACAALIRQHSAQPALDLRHLIGWVFFNLCVGNNDSHAKNLSLYSRPGHGMTLAPFYDLMCTRLYSGLSPNFAFAIGGQTLPGAMTRDNIVALASVLGMRSQFVLRQAADIAQKLPGAMDLAVSGLMPLFRPGAQTVAERLQRFVLSTTKKLTARLSG